MAAATALVGAMATDAWQAARSAVLKLWNRVHSGQAAAIGQQFDEDRSDVLAEDDPQVLDQIADTWARHLVHLLRTDPALETELRRILDQELAPLLSPQQQRQVQQVWMTANASDQGKIYQSAGAMNITQERER